MNLVQALDILARLQDAAPVDLDSAADAPAPCAGGCPGTAPAVPLSPALWPRPADWACLGVRVTSQVADPTALARRLAAMAAERGILPVILTTLDQSGFERFGFRVERLSPAPAAARAAEEAELAAFWNFALVLDAEELMQLG